MQYQLTVNDKEPTISPISHLLWDLSKFDMYIIIWSYTVKCEQSTKVEKKTTAI